MTDDDMRRDPLTREHFERSSNSAHAFWKHELLPSCHAHAHLAVTYFGPYGLIEVNCSECNQLVGVIKVARE